MDESICLKCKSFYHFSATITWQAFISGNLKTTALEPDDFQLVPEELFEFLRDKYGIVSKEHEIPRKVIELKTNRTEHAIVEVFPLQLKFRVPQRADVIDFRLEFSKACSGRKFLSEWTFHSWSFWQAVRFFKEQ